MAAIKDKSLASGVVDQSAQSAVFRTFDAGAPLPCINLNRNHSPGGACVILSPWKLPTCSGVELYGV